MTNDTGIRTPDPDDEDDGGSAFPSDDMQQAADEMHKRYKEYDARLQEAMQRRVGMPEDLIGVDVRVRVPKENDKMPTPKESNMDVPTVKMYGMGNLGEMSKEDLIEELVAHQRDWFEAQDKQTLVKVAIQIRVQAYGRRLVREAGGDAYGIQFSISE